MTPVVNSTLLAVATASAAPASPSSGSDYNGTAGWVPTSNDRGSIDILWSCCVTIFLCVWVSTCPNAPAPSDRWYHAYIDKLNLALIGLLGPDFLFAIATGQLSNAYRSYKKFRDEPLRREGQKWTLRKAFFADMGGFILVTSDYENGFPINAEQLHFLIKYKHVDYPDDEIWEKAFDSIDVLSRLITVWQVFFFTVTEIQRVKQGYPMTTLELTSLSFAFVMLATSAAWFMKPSVSTPIRLRSHTSAAEIRRLSRGVDPAYARLPETWYQTPLMFLSRQYRWTIGVHWNYYVYLAHNMGIKVFSRPMRNPRLWDRLPSDYWHPIAPRFLPFGAVVLAPFSASFIIAWNFEFPTEIEKWWWRGVSVYHCFFCLFGGVYYLVASYMSHNTTQNGKRYLTTTLEVKEEGEGSTNRGGVETGRATSTSHLSRRRRFLDKLRNPSPDGDPKAAMSLRLAIPVTFLCFLYIFCRLYIYAEDFASIRHQPPGVYKTVNHFIPFIGQ